MNPRWGVLRHTVSLFVFAVLVRAALIHLHPIVFGGDTVLRLANRDRVLLAYQLPALQAAIHSISLLGGGVLAVRYFMALIGGLAAVAFYWLAAGVADSRRAFRAALLFASHPFLLQLSIVPYQEVLMLGGLLLAFHGYFAGRLLLSSACLGIACLTRYEAWAASPVLAAAFVLETGLRPRNLAKAVLLFGWAPLAWVIYHAGISAAGTFVIEFPSSPARLLRYIYLAWITCKTTPVPVLILAAAGAWSLYRSRAWHDRRVRVLCAFLALFLVAIPFSAHGEAPDPERFVTAREATLWIAAVLFAAAFGLAGQSRWAGLLTAAGILLGLYSADRFIVRDTGMPKVELSFRLARYLDSVMREDQRALLLVAPIPANLVQDYLHKVARRGGENALRKARELMVGMDISPPDYQRTRIHSRFGRDRLLSFASSPTGVSRPEADARKVDWIAVWSDFQPSNSIEECYFSRIRELLPLETMDSGKFSVRVFRISGFPGCMEARD